MSDQPSEAPAPFLIVVGLVALVALAGTLYVGFSTELSYKPAVHDTAAAPHAPGG